MHCIQTAIAKLMSQITSFAADKHVTSIHATANEESRDHEIDIELRKRTFFSEEWKLN